MGHSQVLIVARIGLDVSTILREIQRPDKTIVLVALCPPDVLSRVVDVNFLVLAGTREGVAIRCVANIAKPVSCVATLIKNLEDRGASAMELGCTRGCGWGWGTSNVSLWSMMKAPSFFWRTPRHEPPSPMSNFLCFGCHVMQRAGESSSALRRRRPWPMDQIRTVISSPAVASKSGFVGCGANAQSSPPAPSSGLL